jgi:predicted MFS family arabinose efflux permease
MSTPAPVSAAAPAAAPDNRSARWSVLAMLFVCRASLGLHFQAVGSVADPLVAQFGFGYADIGLLIGLAMLPGLLLSLPAGWVGSRFSDRHLVAAGLVLVAVGAGVSAAASGFGGLAAGRLVSGVGFVFCTLYFTKMVVDWFVGKELATAMGLLVMSWPLGIAAGQLGYASLAQAAGWRAPFAVASLACAAAAVAVWWRYKSPPGVPAVSARVSAGLPRAELLLTLLAAAVWGCFNAGYLVYLSFAPRVLVAGGYSASQADSVISIASWVMVFSVAGVGRMADRTGRHTQLLLVCLASGAASLLLLQHTAWAVPLSLVFGLLGAAPAGIIMSLTAQAMAPQRRAFGMGVFYSIYYVMVTAAPPLAGWLYDHTGQPFAALLLAVALFVATGLGFAAFGPLRRRLLGDAAS